MAERGQLSINSENMFPIIKKWLYSDHDIFYREIISNGCDAITKLKKLEMMGEVELPEGYKPRIDVILDPDERTARIIDNGLGMTADEVKEYINNIAFSGAEAFMEQYKDKANNDQIIGHFGLGFYSAFMVADLVEIDTKSYKQDAQAVHWSCDGGSEFEMDDSDMSAFPAGSKTPFGTVITLHFSDDCVEFSNYYRAQEVIRKYCGFMPTEIYLQTAGTKDTQTIKVSERQPDDIVIEELPAAEWEVRAVEDARKRVEDARKDGKEPSEADVTKAAEVPERQLKVKKRPELLNDPNPLWAKAPKDCTEEEYKEFYRRLFNDYKEPLFWIHLNMDYPFNLKGILYFPKINLEYESAEGVIKLYNNQVFIADNIREVIPEFLMLLKGVIDCPDLPLNVSRSALQNDGFARKISDYITKKVADKLAGMCKTDKDSYDKYWDDISPFIKYGCLKDEKFCERMNDYILFKDLDGHYLTLPEALEINTAALQEAESDASTEGAAVDENGNKVETEEIGPDGGAAQAGEQTTETGEAVEEEPKDKTIYYVTDEQQQSQYIQMFRDHGLQAFILSTNIDSPFMQQLEMKNEGVHFMRIDAGVDEVLKESTSEEDAATLAQQSEDLQTIIRKALDHDKLTVKIENLKDKGVASLLKVDEQSRRMADMMRMYAAGGMGAMADFAKDGETLVLGAQHPLVQYIIAHQDAENTITICKQLYDLAKIQNAPLDADEMRAFIARSNEIMMMNLAE